MVELLLLVQESGSSSLSEKAYGLLSAAFWIALMLVMLAGAVKMTKKYRQGGFSGNDADGTQDTHNSLTKFKELHARGGLSDEEYRIIKTKLASEVLANAKLPTDTKPDPPPTSPVFESLEEEINNDKNDNLTDEKK